MTTTTSSSSSSPSPTTPTRPAKRAPMRVTLTLVDAAHADDIDPIIRLRIALKHLLRTHRLRCESIVEQTGDGGGGR